MKTFPAPGRGVRPVAALTLALLLASCGGDDPSRPADSTVVAVTPATVSLQIGESKALAATVESTLGAVGSAVTWETSAESVATVSADGVVTGLKPGSAIVTARSVADPRGSGTATIRVKEPPTDLAVIAVTAPATAAAGDTIEVTSTIRNLGPATSTAFTAGTYFSTDSLITTADAFSNYWCRYAGMEAGFTSTCGGKIVVPPALSPGTYWIGMIVDDQGLVAETDETNNAMAPAGPTVITPRR